MKTLIAIVIAAFFASPVFAQTNVQTTQLQAQWKSVTVADAGKQCMSMRSRPVTNHNFVFTVNKGSGAVSAVLVTVTGSTDGTDPPVTSLATSTNTAGDTITLSAVPYTNLCINLTSITGAGSPTVDMSYSGSAVGSGGSVAITSLPANLGTVKIQATDGSTISAVTDPCTGLSKSVAVINIATGTTTQLVAASASNYVYVCSINIGPTAGAQNIALIEDDTSACASPTAGMAGGTTAASGWNIGANGGLAFGSGSGTVAKTAAVNRYVCLISSASQQTSGTMTYVLAP